GERRLGRPRAELVGRPLAELVAPSCRERCATQLAALLAGGDEHGVIRGLSLPGRDGAADQPLELSIERALVGDKPLLFIAIAQPDPTAAELEAASERREARIRLETMLEFAPALIIAVSLRGTIDYINWVLPQYSKADVIGSPWLIYFPPEHAAEQQRHFDAVVATGVATTCEVSTAGADGSTLWYSSHLGPIRSEGKIVGVVIVSQDITERKRTQAELLAARRLAVLGTLAAGVAHEINTPIQFVRDSLHFLRGAGDDILGLVDTLGSVWQQVAPDASHLADACARAESEADLPYLRQNMPAAFDRCLDGLNRVATIVRSLREFAHPSGAEMAPADLAHAIQSTLTICSNEYKYVADIVTKFDADLPPVICHIGEINQAVLNIVVNAAHAIADVVRDTQEKGTITVRARRDGEDVVIEIADTGTGIPEAIRGRIFDPFFTTKEVGRGSGQGLAIAWSVIKDKHGGDLAYDSTVGKGTTFRIRLPIAGKSGDGAVAA
ncbi:MAG: ATP-binding protein, partial [Myxococcota bacterium]